MYRIAVALTVAALLTAWGCVLETKHTIEAHITLDIRHIEQQADDVLNYIEKKSDVLPGAEAPATAEKSKTSWWRHALECMNPFPAAYAEELNTLSPLAKDIAASLRARNDALDALKKSGCLGETNRGYIELREGEALKDAEKRNEAQKLLADENKDRKALYKEIARLNKDQADVSISTVEKVYAMQRLRRAQTGEIFQLPAAGPDFDSFKASPTGQKLGAGCVPEAWVTIP